jgi:antitoxin HigA-1
MKIGRNVTLTHEKTRNETLTPWAKENVMRMKKPPHPGRIVRQECLEPLGLTVTDAARHLGVTRQTLNNLVNEKAGISREMSIRLSKTFGSSPEVWLGLQMEYDLAEAEKDAGKINVKRITRRAVSG